MDFNPGDLTDHITFNTATQQFEIEKFSDSLALLDGQISKSFPISVTLNVYSRWVDGGATLQGTDTATFNVVLKNPCIDTDYVYIAPPNVANF